MKKLSYFLFCLLFVALIVGCDGKKAANPISLPVLSSKRPADHRVVVMLGSEYAGRLELLDGLIAHYGLFDSGGMVERLQYPEAFTVEKKTSLSRLSEAAAIPSTTIVVTVGAPEGTVRELTRIRNAHPEMQLISLFPMDEGLANEAVSSLIVDYAGTGALLQDEDTTALPDVELGLLIYAAVLSGEEKDASIPPLARLTAALEDARHELKQKAVGSRWKFSAYVDPETNLRSRNHVVLATGAGTLSSGPENAAPEEGSAD